MTKKTAQQEKRAQQNNIILGVVVVAVVLAIGLIAINFSGIGSGGPEVDFASIPVTRTQDGAFVAGNPDAPFTLVVFEDYRCSHCVEYEPTIQRYLKDFVETGKAKFEFRMLQTASPDDTIFRLAQCAGEQVPARFFEFREMLFEMAARGWNPASAPRDFASKANLNYSEILGCTAGVTQIATDANLAQEARVTGTPFLLYRDANGNLSSMPIGQAPNYDALKSFVEPQV